MKAFFQKKGLRDYLSLICFLFALIGHILYLALGKNEFNRDISLLCVIPGFLAIFLFLLSFVYPLVFVSEFASFLSLFSLISYIGSQANYLANVFTAIDGSSISTSFVFTFLFLLLSFLLSFILLFLGRKEKKSDIRIIYESDKEKTIHE